LACSYLLYCGQLAIEETQNFNFPKKPKIEPKVELTDNKQLMTAPQIMRHFPFLTDSMLQRWRKKGLLSAVRLGSQKGVFYRPADVEQCIAKLEQPANGPTQDV